MELASAAHLTSSATKYNSVYCDVLEDCLIEDNTSIIHALSKPENKKAVKILRNLCYDVSREQPETPIPSTWLIRCLVNSHFTETALSDWHQSLLCTLTYVKQCAHSTQGLQASFVEIDGIKPLFPNSENFTLEHLKLFVSNLLSHLNKLK